MFRRVICIQLSYQTDKVTHTGRFAPNIYASYNQFHLFENEEFKMFSIFMSHTFPHSLTHALTNWLTDWLKVTLSRQHIISYASIHPSDLRALVFTASSQDMLGRGYPWNWQETSSEPFTGPEPLSCPVQMYNVQMYNVHAFGYRNTSMPWKSRSAGRCTVHAFK